MNVEQAERIEAQERERVAAREVLARKRHDEQIARQAQQKTELAERMRAGLRAVQRAVDAAVDAFDEAEAASHPRGFLAGMNIAARDGLPTLVIVRQALESAQDSLAERISADDKGSS